MHVYHAAPCFRADTAGITPCKFCRTGAFYIILPLYGDNPWFGQSMIAQQSLPGFSFPRAELAGSSHPGQVFSA